MKERDPLRIEGPLGTFLLDEASSRPAILLAAGTGFAPFESMIESALHAGVSRRLHLYRGARTFADLYDHERVLGWLERYPALRYTPVLSAPRPEDGWTGRVGHVQDAVLADHGRLDVISVYACGPPWSITHGQHFRHAVCHPNIFMPMPSSRRVTRPPDLACLQPARQVA